MKTVKKLTIGCLLFLGCNTASAGTMNCGTHIIIDGQLQGQSREEIKEKCGAPLREVSAEVIYKKNGVTYKLHFNGNNELETITVVER